MRTICFVDIVISCDFFRAAVQRINFFLFLLPKCIVYHCWWWIKLISYCKCCSCYSLLSVECSNVFALCVIVDRHNGHLSFAFTYVMWNDRVAPHTWAFAVLLKSPMLSSYLLGTDSGQCLVTWCSLSLPRALLLWSKNAVCFRETSSLNVVIGKNSTAVFCHSACIKHHYVNLDLFNSN